MYLYKLEIEEIFVSSLRLTFPLSLSYRKKTERTYISLLQTVDAVEYQRKCEALLMRRLFSAMASKMYP